MTADHRNPPADPPGDGAGPPDPHADWWADTIDRINAWWVQRPPAGPAVRDWARVTPRRVVASVAALVAAVVVAAVTAVVWLASALYGLLDAAAADGRHTGTEVRWSAAGRLTRVITDPVHAYLTGHAAALHTSGQLLWLGWLAVTAILVLRRTRQQRHDDPDYLTYAGLDAIACRRLADLLVPLTQAPASLLRIETWLAAQANRIQLRGMRVDRDALDTLTAEARRETSQAEQTIKEVTGGVPARSPKLHEWLAGHGVDWEAWPGARTDTGKPSLAKDNVKLLLGYPLDQAARTVVDQLIRFKAHQDALNKTTGVHDHLTADGRVHPVLHTLGAVTARMSSSGPNFQNFSKRDPRMRGMFLPEPDHVLLTADFDQIELRVVAALARETKMIDVILAGGDLHQLTADEIDIPRDLAKMTNFLCVPLDSEILTKRGWLCHDEVKVGDETLGYDPDTGTMRWTEVEALHRYDDADLVRLGNGQTWSATCTPDHSWVEERRRFVGQRRQMVRGFVRTREINTESRLLLSAPAEFDGDLDLTPAECGVIAWTYGDGSIRLSELTGRTSQGLDGGRRHVSAKIFQSKEAGLVELDAVLQGIPHGHRVRKPVGTLRPIHEFSIAPDVARAIWARAGLLDGGSLSELVLRISRQQREAFSRAAFAAEGHTNGHGQRIIPQNEGDFCDAIELAAFLDGNYVRRYAPTYRGNLPTTSCASRSRELPDRS
jgi:hypothetical protein